MTMRRLIENIVENKILFSGIGIFLVMLYHQPTDGFISGLYFYPGFVGVDIFLFFSGFSLCYSFEKNSLSQFYKRRIIRVFPLLLVLGFLVSFNYSGYTIWDYVCNMTSLFYYRLGGDVYEWYLAALLLFYLLFPAAYLLCQNKLINSGALVMGGSILLVWAIFLGIVVKFDVPWYYQTAMGRLPIFIFGILCKKSLNNFKVGLWAYLLLFIPVVFLFLKGWISTYYLVYCIAPWVMIIISLTIPQIRRVKVLNQLLAFMGEHSLEIYVANVLVSVYTKSLFHGSITTVIYWSLHLIMIPAFCLLNSFIKRRVVA